MAYGEQPLSAVASLENLRNSTRDDPHMRMAGDVVPIPTEKNLNSLQWQFIKSQIPFLGRGMDPNQIRQQIMDVNSQLRPKQVSENITPDWLAKRHNKLMDEFMKVQAETPRGQDLLTRMHNNSAWYNDALRRERGDE